MLCVPDFISNRLCELLLNSIYMATCLILMTCASFISDDPVTSSDSDSLRPITTRDFEAALEKMRHGGKYVTNVIGFNLD
jgi:hypothetical protein